MNDFFSRLPDELWISRINIPGTHDSCTAFCTMENMSRCQSLTVKEQLCLGIRLFDIRLYKRGNSFYLCHALADCFCDSSKAEKLSFDKVLSDFREFIRENPEETLIVSVKQDRGIMNRFFFPSFYKKYIKENSDEWVLTDSVPRLVDCRGKLVLMRRCKVFPGWKKKNPCGLDFSYWKDQGSKRTEKIYTVNLSKKQKAVVQDRYGLEPERKWEKCARPFLDLCTCDKDNICLHFISTAYRYKGETLEKTAKQMNSFFKSYDLKADKGWFFFDFPDEDIIEKFSCQLFNDNNKEKTK